MSEQGSKKFEIHKSPDDIRNELMEKLDALYQQVSSAELVIYARYPDFRNLLEGAKEKVKDIQVTMGDL